MPKKSPSPTDKYIGSRVRARRLALGMSQEKLGDALGLTFQQVQKYEKGTNRIGGSRMVQIATALRIPTAWFFDGAPNMSGDIPKGTMTDTAYTRFVGEDEGMQVLKHWPLLSKDQRRQIGALAKMMAKEE